MINPPSPLFITMGKQKRHDHQIVNKNDASSGHVRKRNLIKNGLENQLRENLALSDLRKEMSGDIEVKKSSGRDDVCDTSVTRDSICYWLLFIGVCCLSFSSRLHRIKEPDHVCWDETHFGKMGSWYINHTFFFDVHPPLGKMLIGLSGYLTGYDGSFHFSKPGNKYEDTPYVGMRIFCACLGALIVPVIFSMTWNLTKSLTASVMAASFIVFDTGTLTLSQYILLDPILMFFIFLASWSLVKFYNSTLRSFSLVWWIWLSSTGFFLACAMSVKFVGLFVVLLVGVTVAWDLWKMISDLTVDMVFFMKKFLAMVLTLVVLPAIVYLAFFYIHFTVLSRSGNGDGFFSSAFQSQLQGNTLYNASLPAGVAYGSIVTIKNHRTAGAYLHSHSHLYPEGIGARQQQVTTYSYKDENNKWLIKPYNREPQADDSIQMVKNGDLIRLEHTVTKRNLHSHMEMAPLTRQHYQVTCYGEKGAGDSNDLFWINIPGTLKGEPLRTVKSVFRLVHVNLGCAVHSHNKQLPKWGWEQMEVTCNPTRTDKRSLWNVEEVIDHRLPNVSFEVYAPSFLEKIIESHAVMTQGNKNLKPKEGEVTSQPWQWPLNYKGQPFSGGEHRIYLLGNPVIWWLNLGVIVVFTVYSAISMILQQRSPQHITDKSRGVLCSCGWLFLGWALHYVPFWTMTRVLYFHHYFPAFIYNSMLSGVFIDHVLRRTTELFSQKQTYIFHCAVACLLGAISYSFYLFSPLSYGMTETINLQEYQNLKWLNSWDI